jgi:hypothetical protein
VSEIPHGTVNGYTNRRCRCTPCLQAERAYKAAWRAAHAGDVPDGYHGRRSTYINRGCRCDPCREAAMRYQRDYRAKQRVGGRP